MRSNLKFIIYKLIFIIFYFFTLHFFYKSYYTNFLASFFYFMLFIICLISTISYFLISLYIRYKREQSFMNISSKILKYSYLFIIIVITLTFIYKTFIYDSKYEPYILKKLSIIRHIF